MRQTKSTPTEPESQQAEADIEEPALEAEELEIPAAPPPPPATPEPASPAPERVWGGPYTRMMAMDESARSDALEEAVQSGLTTRLVSKTGEVVRCSYGERVLEIPPKPREFMGAHAIHVLWYMSDQVGELED